MIYAFLTHVSSNKERKKQLEEGEKPIQYHTTTKSPARTFNLMHLPPKQIDSKLMVLSGYGGHMSLKAGDQIQTISTFNGKV